MAAFNEDYHERSLRIPGWFFLLCILGGAFFFFRNYGIAGLDQVSVFKRQSTDETEQFINYKETSWSTENAFNATKTFATESATIESTARGKIGPASAAGKRIRNLRIASWSLGGFDPNKLTDPLVRRNAVRVIRQFDVVALQQISSLQRDTIARLVEAVNEGDQRYEYVIGQPTGPKDHREQLAFLFDIGRVKVDRTQTYTLADPENHLRYDPLVAWFQAAQLSPDQAWTFSLVNVRVDLSRAPAEVALMPNIMTAVRLDGRGEDDVVMAGLFQADDAYLIPSMASQHVRAAVRGVPTDIYRRHQTSNILVDTQLTSEFVGRGGAFDFLRVYNLSASEAEMITTHLPVFAEFTVGEGGEL